MKALIVSSVYGFLTKFECQNVELLKSMGIEIHYASNHTNIVYEDCEDIVDEYGIIYHDIPIKQQPHNILSNLKAIIQVREIIKREGINIIHCHTPTGGMVARLACLGIKGVYVIYTAHGFHFYNGGSKLSNKVFYWAEDFMSRNTNAIVTINHEDESAAKSMHADIVYRIPGEGIDSKFFQLTDEKERKQERAKLGIAEDDFFVITIGEIRPNKNQKRVIETLDYIVNKYKSNGPNIIYGVIGHGRQEDKLKEYVKVHGIENNVRFFGYELEIRTFLKAADAMIFPSIREGLGMAALEALFTGLPVIASSNRGSKEYIKNQKNGILVPEDSVGAYAKALKALYYGKKDKSIYERDMIRKSVMNFEKAESKKIMRKVYEDAINKCIVSGL